VIRNQFHAIAHAGADATFETDAFAAIDPTGFVHGVRDSGKQVISSSAAARRVAACSSQRSPFSAVAGRGSPITPLDPNSALLESISASVVHAPEWHKFDPKKGCEELVNEVLE